MNIFDLHSVKIVPILISLCAYLVADESKTSRICLEPTSGNELILETKDGDTYFMQSSANLYDWDYEFGYFIGDGSAYTIDVGVTQESATWKFYRYRSAATNTANVHDTDGDGILNDDELDGGEDDDPSDPMDFYNGDDHFISIISGDEQLYSPGKVGLFPIVFHVKDKDDNPLANAPITVSLPGELTSGGYSLTPDGANPLPLHENVRSDQDGNVSVWFVAPADS